MRLSTSVQFFLVGASLLRGPALAERPSAKSEAAPAAPPTTATDSKVAANETDKKVSAKDILSQSPSKKAETANDAETLSVENKGAFQRAKPLAQKSSDEQDLPEALKSNETQEASLPEALKSDGTQDAAGADSAKLEFEKHGMAPRMTGAEVEHFLEKERPSWDPNILKAARAKHGTIEELLTPRQEDAHSIELRHKLDELEEEAINEQTRQLRAQQAAGLAKHDLDATRFPAAGAAPGLALLQVAESQSARPAPEQFKGHQIIMYDKNGDGNKVEATVTDQDDAGLPTAIGFADNSELKGDQIDWGKASIKETNAQTGQTAPTAQSAPTSQASQQEGGKSGPQYPPPVITQDALEAKYNEHEAKTKPTPEPFDFKAQGKDDAHERQQLLGTSLRYDQIKNAFDNHRDQTKALYNTMLDSVAGETGLTGHEQYKDFLASVLAVKPEHLADVITKANDAVAKNDIANKKSYEYIDDVERLSDGAAVGYNRVGMENMFAYDQIRAQIEEGHMAPNRAIRIMFPLSGDVNFQGSRGELLPASEEYMMNTFAEQVKAKLEKYKGFHFCFCVHAATNLGPMDAPLYHDSHYNGQQTPMSIQVGHDPSGAHMQVVKGMVDLMNERTATMQAVMKKIVKEKVGLRDEEYTFPDLQGVGMHFQDALFPSGAIVAVAEDRLHHEDDHMTDHEKEHREQIWKHQCDLKDFRAMTSFGNFDEYAKPMMNIHELRQLPESRFAMTAEELQRARENGNSFEAHREAQASNVGWQSIQNAHNEAREKVGFFNKMRLAAEQLLSGTRREEREQKRAARQQRR